MGFKPGGFSSASSSPSLSLPVYTKEDKWKLASQLQKAIRHGRVDEAGQAAADLGQLERAYLRYRLAVIAVEDVAAGTPSVVMEAFAGGWKKAQVDARGGTEFLIETSRLFAASVKDRTPCDFLSCSRWIEDFQVRHGSWENMSENTATLMALDEGRPWWERGLAAWRAAGTKRFPGARLPEVQGDWEAWKMACQGRYGDTAATLMAIGEAQREAHPVFLGLAMGAQGGAPGLRTPAIPDLPRVGPWLSAALDKHTSEGRRALSNLMSLSRSGSEVMASAGVELARQQELVGRMWFWMEGGRCDKELHYPLATAIRQETQSRVLDGVDPHLLIESFGDTSLWQLAREKAMGYRSSPRP